MSNADRPCSAAELSAQEWNQIRYTIRGLLQAGFMLFKLPPGQNQPPPAGWNKPGFPLWLDESAAVDQLNRGGNVAVAGELVGSCILDVDSTSEAGDFILKMQELESETLCWWTPRGLQAAVWCPELKQTQTKGAGGIDVRAALGGYGLLPGSWRSEESYKDKNGKWKEGAESLKFPALYMPLRGQAPIAKLTDEARQWIERKNQVVRANAATGNGRHRDMLTLTGRMVHAGASEARIETAKRSFVAEVSDRADATTAEKEFRRAVEGAKRKGYGKGRPPVDAPVTGQPEGLSLEQAQEESEIALQAWKETEYSAPLVTLDGVERPKGNDPVDDDQDEIVSETAMAAYLHDAGHWKDYKAIKDQGRWAEWRENEGWTPITGSRMVNHIGRLSRGKLSKVNVKAATGYVPDPVRNGRISFQRSVATCFAELDGVFAPSECWDTDPRYVGLPGCMMMDLSDNGVHLRTREHLMVLKLGAAPAPYEGSRWKKLLESAFECAHTRLALQVAFGGLLAPSPNEYFILLQGKTGSGKTTLSEAILSAFGDGYGTSTDPNMIGKDADPFTRINAKRMIQGKRAAIIPELTPGITLSEEALKTMGGGRDTIATRAIGGEMYTFKPTHGLAVVSNDLPWLARRSAAVERRIYIIPMDRVLPDSQKESLDEVFRQPRELGAIVTWLVDGYAAWRAHGLVPPSPLMEARRQEWVATCDPLGAFLRDSCKPSGSMLVRELLRHFQDWQRASGRGWPVYAQTAFKFKEELKERGYGIDQSKKNRLKVAGLSLLDSDD